MQVFSDAFYLAFFSPCAFLYFPLRKAASCSKYTYCHSRKLEFFSNLGSDNSPSLFLIHQLISFLNLTNPATSSLYYSSVGISFHPSDNTMTFTLKIDCSIRSFSDFCLIMAKCLWSTGSIWPPFDPRAKYRFALVCRFIFCYFVEFYLYI